MSDKTTRDHIVEAADQLFYRQGFEHTSFSDIADAVQISRGNFYYHFKSKDEILDAVINVRLANTRKMLERWEIEGKLPGRHVVYRACEAESSLAKRVKQAIYPVSHLAAQAVHAAWPQDRRRRAGDASSRPRPGRRHAGKCIS